MKRVSLLENGDILYFSNIIEKDDGLKIYCQAIEKATRNKFLPVEFLAVFELGDSDTWWWNL